MHAEEFDSRKIIGNMILLTRSKRSLILLLEAVLYLEIRLVSFVETCTGCRCQTAMLLEIHRPLVDARRSHDPFPPRTFTLSFPPFFRFFVLYVLARLRMQRELPASSFSFFFFLFPRWNTVLAVVLAFSLLFSWYLKTTTAVSQEILICLLQRG